MEMENTEEKLCGWESSDQQNFHFQQQFLIPIKPMDKQKTKKPHKIEKIKSLKNQCLNQSSSLHLNNSRNKKHEVFKEKKLKRNYRKPPSQPDENIVKEAYKLFNKEISYPMMNGTYLKYEKLETKQAPCCSIDNCDSFCYSIDHRNSSNSQIIVRNYNKTPCSHQLRKILEKNEHEKKSKHKKMIEFEQKENYGQESGIKLKGLSTVKIWCRFPSKIQMNLGKSTHASKISNHKVKKCFSTHLDFSQKYRENLENSAFKIDATKVR